MTDSTTRIEEDLRVTRARMDHRLTELKEHLTPGQILDDMMAYFRDSDGADFGRSLVTSLRRNPLPAAVTGIGLAWLMVASTGGNGSELYPPAAARPAPDPNDDWSGRTFETRLDEVERETVRQPDESEAAWRERLDQARGSVMGMARAAGETAESFASRISEAKDAMMRNVHDIQDGVAAAASQVGSAARYAGDTVRQAGQQAGDVVKQASEKVVEGGRAAREAGAKVVGTVSDNPLLMAALAIGAGAVLGALIPQSEKEAAALEDVAGKLRRSARDVAQSAVDRGTEVADKALAAGEESARDRGLTASTTVGQVLDGLQSGDLVRKVEDVAVDTLHSTGAALRREGGQDGNAETRAGARGKA